MDNLKDAIKPSNGRKRQEERKSRVYFVNQFDLDPNEPIPISFNGDLFRYAGSRKYIPFLGKDDNFADFLLNTRLNSPTQHACIDSIAKSLIGKGLSAANVENLPDDFVKWSKSVNNRRQSLNKLLTRAVDGERGMGNQFIEIRRGKVGSQKYLKVYLHSMLFSRLKSMPEPDAVIISKLIAKRGYVSLKKEDAIEIPLWDDNMLTQGSVWRKMPDGGESTMLHFKNDTSAVEDYGLPQSIACVRQQLLEAKSAQYNIDNFDNNMILGGILRFKSGMTPAEAEETAQEILASHVGAGRMGRVAVISAEGGIDEAEFTPYNTQKEGSFVEYSKSIQDQIIYSNGWDPILLGINRASSMGTGSQHIRSIWDVKESSLLSPLRTSVIESIIIPIVKIYVDWFGADQALLDNEWTLQTAMPFSYMADLDPNKFFQVNEARNKAGLKNDDTYNGVYLAEVTGVHQPNQFNNGYVKTDGTNEPGETNK